MQKTILISKESRAGEARVALVPHDLAPLLESGYRIFLEHDAGIKAGFDDQAYETAGAVIRYRNQESLEAYRELYKDIDIIVRVKRPERSREILESQAIVEGTVMIGAFDPLEKHSPHIAEYTRAGISAYSIDQLKLTSDDPMNVLAAMSKIAGRLALLDALEKFKAVARKVVIIGFGVIGRLALEEASLQQLDVTVILTNEFEAEKLMARGVQVQLLDKTSTLSQQQDIIKDVLLDADIVISSARQANQPAPTLVPASTLHSMKKGAVIVDMALSEGGNVEGSEHDVTRTVGNDAIVTNVSGYPKAVPEEASLLWSAAIQKFILRLHDAAFVNQCKV